MSRDLTVPSPGVWRKEKLPLSLVYQGQTGVREKTHERLTETRRERGSTMRDPFPPFRSRDGLGFYEWTNRDSGKESKNKQSSSTHCPGQLGLETGGQREK